jgi:hypothetical protein
MCETGHTEPRVREAMRDALGRLEEALSRHEQQLPLAGADPSDPALQILRRSVELMQQEADRLRMLLQD